MSLKDWIQIYLKNRDVFQKSIQRFEDYNGGFIVHKANSRARVLIRPDLKDVEDLKEGSVFLVVLNTKKNVLAVIANWDLLSANEKLCIFFVNPDSNEKWILYPFTHDRITEKSSLKRGLLSLFSSISAV